MKIDISPFAVADGEKISLAERPTRVDPFYASKSDYEDALQRHSDSLGALQERLYVAGSHALLLVLQGMDSSGKDGAVKHVMTGVNPQGCKIVSFKAPTTLETRHDFLWRCSRQLPERGLIGVFNRSYYEAVLVERVHPKLLEAEGLTVDADKLDKLWERRFRAIREFERNLIGENIAVVKIFLHISKDEQKKRLMARVDDPQKAWKAAFSDVTERQHWRDYQRAYEAALSATSAEIAPWLVVPADDKRNARLIVSQIVIEALQKLPLQLPPLDEARKKELELIRKALEAE